MEDLDCVSTLLRQAIVDNDALIRRRAQLYVRRQRRGSLSSQAVEYFADEAVARAYSWLFEPKNLGRFDTSHDPLPWILSFLYRSVQSDAVKDGRRAQWSTDHLGAFSREFDSEEDAFAACVTPDWPMSGDGVDIATHERVETILGRLSPKDADLLRLHYVDGVPTEDLAASQGISVGALYCRLTRARARARAR